MRLNSRTLVAAALATAVGLGVSTATTGTAGAAEGDAPSIRALGLSGNGQDLFTFYLDDTRKERKVGKVKGLDGDTKLVGIDMRPANNRFYGVGNAGGVYTINSATGVAAKVSQLSVDLSGTDFGVDFNPAADRLRVVSDTRQNLRHNVDAPTGGTINDGALTADGVVAAAYTNNDKDAATGTLLYDINATTGQIVTQVPANDGTLIANGPLGVATTGVAGLDIASLRNKAGVTIDNYAVAVLRPTRTNFSKLYEVELQSGAATLIGSFDVSIADIAVQHQ